MSRAWVLEVTPKEEKVIRLCFGIGSEREHTLEEIEAAEEGIDIHGRS